MKDTTKNARPDEQTEQKINTESLSAKTERMSRDICWYGGKIVARIIDGKAYKRRVSTVKELEEIAWFFHNHQVFKADVLPDDEFDKLDDGNDKLVIKLKEPFDLSNITLEIGIASFVLLKEIYHEHKTIAAYVHWLERKLGETTGESGLLAHTGKDHFDICTEARCLRTKALLQKINDAVFQGAFEGGDVMAEHKTPREYLQAMIDYYDSKPHVDIYDYQGTVELFIGMAKEALAIPDAHAGLVEFKEKATPILNDCVKMITDLIGSQNELNRHWGDESAIIDPIKVPLLIAIKQALAQAEVEP